MSLRIPSRRGVAAVAVTLLAASGAALASSGDSVATPVDILQASVAQDLTCTARPYPKSDAVDQRSFTSSVTGIVQARLSGGGDWDLAVFDTDTGAVVAGSAGYASNELAEGFVTKGQKLLVQACRFRGAAAKTQLGVDFFAAPDPDAGSEKTQLVTVATPTRTDKESLQSLGLDLTEKGTDTSVDVVLHGKADAKKLADAHLDYTVRVADLDAKAQRNRASDRSNASASSQLPSGRTTYRRLFDYELEMKRLAIANPDLVRPLTLPETTLEGRSVEGIEITANAQNTDDGKPVFLQLGVHHAREWPSAELPMEFGYDLVRSYRAGGARARQIAATRTVIVPIVNPDGFNISREAPSIGEDFSRFDYEYKRKNCRASDSPAKYRGGTCGANPGGADRGTDPNRNYAGFWGGPGASTSWDAQDYRGSKPFSEPETRNVRALISNRQVVTLITNHTYGDDILRPPSLYSTRPPLEDKLYEKLGNRLTARNGYDQIRGFQLYDTSGSTEDWSYWNTGGLAFTFETGPEDFHPDYASAVVGEYLGTAAAPNPVNGGNRGAYYEMLDATASTDLHSTIEGTAPEGMVLRVHKKFSTPTSPVIRADGTTGDPIRYTDVLDTTYSVPGGKFSFAVNPSTRPYVAGRLGRDPVAPVQPNASVTNPAGVPDENQGDPLEGASERIPFTVQGPPQADNALAEVSIKWASSATDWDVYILDADGNVVGSSADAGTTSENARLVDPVAGNYTAVIVNFSGGAASDWTGAVNYTAPQPTTYGPTEKWMLTCETPSGRVRAARQVFVARGQTVDVGSVCQRR